MTLIEAQELGKQLTDINIKYWDASSNDKHVFQDQFRNLCRTIKTNGFKIKSYKTYNETMHRVIPMFKITENTSASFIMFSNNAPIEVKGDCTTRCISFCTGVDYMTIRNEQLNNAAYSGRPWRNRGVWEKSLISRGFKVIELRKRMTRKTFIKTFGNNIKHGIIATLSSGHVAAIDMEQKKVLDTWDSTGGRISAIYVHCSQYPDVLDIIERTI